MHPPLSTVTLAEEEPTGVAQQHSKAYEMMMSIDMNQKPTLRQPTTHGGSYCVKVWTIASLSTRREIDLYVSADTYVLAYIVGYTLSYHRQQTASSSIWTG